MKIWRDALAFAEDDVDWSRSNPYISVSLKTFCTIHDNGYVFCDEMHH